MNKELQDQAWSVLPKEFKEEVKKAYRIATKGILSGAKTDDISLVDYSKGWVHGLEEVFGYHNLTSDAEGEEMLYCEKSKVRTMYDNAADMIVGNQLDSEAAQMAMLTKGLFEELFGSKCLPDKEPKPAEPTDNYIHVDGDLDKSASTCTDDCPSQSKSQYLNLSQSMSKCDKYNDNTLTNRENNRQDHIGENSEMVDSIIKDSFRNHNRLHIAALAMQGLLFDGMRDPDTVAEVAFEYADALIRKSKKGGDDGKD